MLIIDDRVAIADDELSFAYARSSGPGGQNVNKVNSKVILTWSPIRTITLPEPVRRRFLAKYGGRLTKDGDLLIVSQRFRDRPKNVEDCRSKLREMIQSVLAAPKVRRPTKPSRGSKERRLTEKRRRSETKARRRDVGD